MQSSTSLTIVVGKTFSEIVMRNPWYVLMEYHGPYRKCSECKELMPMWEHIGELYTGVEGITMGKMDVTSNEVLGLEVHSLPTLALYSAGDKYHPGEFKKFSGIISPSNIMKWIVKETGIKPKNEDHPTVRGEHDEL